MRKSQADKNINAIIIRLLLSHFIIIGFFILTGERAYALSNEQKASAEMIWDADPPANDDGSKEYGYYSVYQNGVLDFDTSYGPNYKIDYNTGELIHCSSSGGKIILFNKIIDILTLVVYSDEFPVNRTYKIDLSRNRVNGAIIIQNRVLDLDALGGDTVDYFSIDGNVLSFDSLYGPYYQIDINQKVILNCSSDGMDQEKARLVSLVSDDKNITLTVWSAELPQEVTYTFDKSASGSSTNPTIITDNSTVDKRANAEMIWGEEPAGYTGDDKEYGQYRVYHNGVVSFDTNFGPAYDIDYNSGQIINCSSSGANIISYQKAGDVITLVVYSDEFPTNRLYSIDLSKNKDNGSVLIPGRITDLESTGGDKLDYYSINGNLLSFDSVYGPAYLIDLGQKSILDCSSDSCFGSDNKAKIINLDDGERYITLTVWSAELPQNVTYIFDRKATSYGGNSFVFEDDTIDYYFVYEKDNVIEFDSEHGPWYVIDYKNKKILGCTSGGAQIKDLSVNGNKLQVTLYSQEYPTDKNYEFDLNENNRGNYDESSGYSSLNYDGSSFTEKNGKDSIDYFNVFREQNILEFDSEFGPYYKIDLKNKKILDCTSDMLYPNTKAILYACNDYGDRITVKVYSAELPYKMTYNFDLTKNGQVAGIYGYNDEKLETEIKKILSEVQKGSYSGKGLDSKTLTAVKNALNSGKEITPVVSYRSDNADDLDKKTLNLIDKTAQNNELDMVQYISISIELYVDAELIGNITELKNAVDFTLFVNQDEADSAEDFSVIQVHNGKPKILDADGKDKVKFATKEFSDYALVKKSHKSYKVKFDLMGHGSKIKAQEIKAKGRVIKPSDPSAKGYIFKGWYKDKKFKTAYKFNTKVKSSFTLYAKWQKVTDKTNFTIGKGNKKLKYVVISQSKKTVGFKGAPAGATSVEIPATVKYCGNTYKVISIEKQALYKNKNIKKLTIGKNVKSIGVKAVSGCSKLKEMNVKSTKLTKADKNAFSDLSSKLKVKVPKKNTTKYKNLFRKAGLSKSISVKAAK